MIYHISALLHEVISYLDPKPGDLTIDATIGGAGHTQELLKRGARVLGIDRDPEALDYVKSLNLGSNLILRQANFNRIGEIARENGFENVQGILLDLGVSSHQLDEPGRGFSFQKEGPLDMRMDPTLTLRAYDIVNHFEERRLHEILETYGQEKFSRLITRAICSARSMKPIETTKELAEIIKSAVPRGVSGKKKLSKNIHPATKTFQALRIIINSELLNLEETLPQTVDLLKVGGRLAVISFHSLEDAQVKRFFKQETRLKVITRKPIGPSQQEKQQNPRARSAKLRVAEKI